MSDECPNCETGALGSQIVELPHPTGDSVSYGIICSVCGVVYQSQEARNQIEGKNK